MGTEKRKKSRTQTASKRKAPGTTGKGDFYRIEVAPKSSFETFRTQDVGRPGGVERVAGKRKNGTWDTATWLVSKKDAHVNNDGELVIDDTRAKTVLKQISGKITRVKKDIFKAKKK